MTDRRMMTGNEDTSVMLRRKLEDQFNELHLARPFRRACYDPGHRLEYAVTGVSPAHEGRIAVEVERFVGGGFAGQVYCVKLLRLEGEIQGLEEGTHYAVKILKPPSGLARAFRNFLYFLAYQSHFGAQVNPDAVRVGVLWQKLIRRAAAKRFDDPGAVCDTYATFYDDDARSFGEINQWVDGRIWAFEVDDKLFDRWSFGDELPKDHNCPEYVSKKKFMDDLVSMLHEMGAGELARQYEWWTMKSQPNALKRRSGGSSGRAGLTAIDFRAGLALLPFLPMSPADLRLIPRGLFRGRIVQFDRSDRRRFDRFIEEHEEDFRGLEPAVEELREKEQAYRASMPDVTCHRFRLLADSGLRRSIKKGAITSWKNLGRIDEEHARRLDQGKVLFLLLYVISFMPLLGKCAVKLWGSGPTREHLVRCVSSFAYLVRAMKGRRIETLVAWQRQGRVGDDRVVKLVDRPVRYWTERVLFGWLPAKWHRLITEPSHAWRRTREAVSFAVEFLRAPSFREECLLEQVRMGREEGMLSGAEADRIENEARDPYIQKYLRCLAVHACTVPVTRVVMVALGASVTAYCLAYKQLGWAESMALGIGAAAAMQLMPVSPGSITRGLFVIYMMIKDRDVKSYRIAAPVSFLHVVGYLAFPLQMVSSNPALARFLAARWTRKMVQLVPVFGERGGLLEHWAFDCLFNLPLSIRRGVKVNPAGWAVGSTAATFALAGVVFLGYGSEGSLPGSEVFSITPRIERGDDLHASGDGMQVQFAGTDHAVDFSPGNWDEPGHPPRRGLPEISASRRNGPPSGGEQDSRGEVFWR